MSIASDMRKAQALDNNQAQFERKGNPWFDPKRDAPTPRIAPNVRHAAPKREFRDPPSLRQAGVSPEAQARRERIREALAKGKPKKRVLYSSVDTGLRYKKDARDCIAPPSDDLNKRIADAEARDSAWQHTIEQRRAEQERRKRAEILAEYGITEE